MKKIKRRSVSVFAFVLLLTVCLCVFLVKYVNHAEKWAAFSGNGNAYSSGVIRFGSVTDRNGVLLLKAENGEITFSEDKTLRKATLHAVGDKQRNIGTGAITTFAAEIIGYDAVNGLYSYSGGGTTALTIDAKLNTAAYEALDGRSGCVAVMDYTTGELLCMVSTPSFDPELPPSLSDDDTSGVYINRFLSAAYTPGSVFKLVTLAAAIENIDNIYDRVFTCCGSKAFADGTVSCTSEHGKLKIEDALAVSCNCVFGELAVELGADMLEKYADKFGFLEGFDVNGIKTAAGKYEKTEDSTINLAWSGVGQYNDTVNPAAMLRFVSAIANGGKAPDMSLLLSSVSGDAERVMSEKTAEALAGMMNYAAVKTYGRDNFPGLELYAKSGTAEVGTDRQPHAWFTGFITNEGYPLTFIVVVENGGWGSTAAGTVANSVLQKAIKE